MNEEICNDWQTKQLEPFGLSVKPKKHCADLKSIPVTVLKEWIDSHQVVVLRGFKKLDGEALPEFCKNLGEILQWDFGAVNELKVRADSPNYLFTNREVPFHWDGAFVNRPPHYIFFHCDEAPHETAGGETLFCQTEKLLAGISNEEKTLWREIEITYTTEKIVHYGGSFTAKMIAHHPKKGTEILRFAEPVRDLNPVELEIKGLPAELQKDFLTKMRRRLREKDVCYSHRWQAGDIVVADNFALLHGRRAFAENARRLIRRVNIL